MLSKVRFSHFAGSHPASDGENHSRICLAQFAGLACGLNESKLLRILQSEYYTYMDASDGLQTD